MFKNCFNVPNHPYLSEPIQAYDFSLTEDHLHYLWKHKAFNLTETRLSNGLELRVNKFGKHNAHESGPDFNDCEIVMDGLQWYGRVEMHLKSSDWYAHKHDKDAAYDSVILHVVWKHDMEVYVNGKPLPTLALKDWIVKSEFDRLVNFLSQKKDRPCSSQWETIPANLINEQLNLALQQRLTRKTDWIKMLLNHSKTREQAIYVILGMAFGTKTNSLPFSELLMRIPYDLLKQTRFKSNCNLLHGASNLIKGEDTNEAFNEKEFADMSRNFDVEPMKASSWIFGGLRPISFPSIRIAQFSTFIHAETFDQLFDPDFNVNIANVKKMFKNKVNEYWSRHYVWGKRVVSDVNCSPTDTFVLGLILNAILPIHLVIAEENGNEERVQNLMKMLNDLPAEKNSALNWIKNKNIFLKNAGQTQAVLELNNEFCVPRRCLDCLIGNSLMK
jgi:hypothetical protein